MQLVLELVVRSVNGCKYCDKRPVSGAVTVRSVNGCKYCDKRPVSGAVTVQEISLLTR